MDLNIIASSNTSFLFTWKSFYSALTQEEFMLTYNFTELSGLFPRSGNMSISIMDINNTENGGNFQYMLKGLLPYTSYNIFLSPIYDTFEGDIITVSGQTLEGG